jgi:phosphatidylglycerol:prolipoprotein diacylglycerol transferase
MLPYLQLGPVRIWTYGLMLCCGLWAGFCLFRAELRRRNLPVNAGNLLLAIGAAGIAGAKAYHIVVTRIYVEHLAVTWRDVLNPAGLAWNGGLLCGFAVLVFFAAKNQVSLWSLLDAASPAAAVGYAFGRMGCFLSGDGDYGVPTNLPWGMSFPHGLVPTTQRVHPTPIYEILASLLLLYILLQIARKSQSSGIVFAAYLIGSGISRFAVEFIRLNPPALLGLTEAQLISLLSVIAGAVLLIVLRKPQALADAAGHHLPVTK